MERDKFIENFEFCLEGVIPGSLTMETKFKQLDEWDSMEALSLIAMIDAEYQIQISAEELRSAICVQDIYDIIVSKKNI